MTTEYASDKKELLIKCETWKFAWMDFWKFRQAFYDKYKKIPREAL